MTAISTNSSVLAIKVESTEGTPASPASASDFVALQPGFAIDPGRESLQNVELKASIGAGKSISGAENPTTSIVHYLKASGTAGTAPEYNDLMKAFFGAEVVASTEYDLTSGSTTTALEFPGGDGANFQRGQGLLIKDGTNGYRVRVVDSMSTDTANISFKLANAPASGVNTGKCVLWKPANSGHQTLSMWHYIGNGGARELITGCRVTSLSVDATANQLINATFGIEGIKYYFNPIEITSSTCYLDWTDDDGTFAAAVTVKWYDNPHDLAAALQTAMRAANSGETATVTYSNSTGKFNIKTTGTVLTLKWNTGTNTANTIGTKLGFLVAADDSGTAATTGYNSDSAQTLVAPYTPSFDSSDPLVAKNQEVMIGDQDDYACFGASSVTINGTDARRAIESICAESGQSGSIINGRSVTIDVVALLDQYEAEKFYKFQQNSEIRFQYTMGSKTGGNWDAGKVVYAYAPTAVISSINVSNDDGLATLNMSLTCFVNASGEGEFYMGTL